jgi:hypothetical protein
VSNMQWLIISTCYRDSESAGVDDAESHPLTFMGKGKPKVR